VLCYRSDLSAIPFLQLQRFQFHKSSTFLHPHSPVVQSCLDPKHRITGISDRDVTCIRRVLLCGLFGSQTFSFTTPANPDAPDICFPEALLCGHVWIPNMNPLYPFRSGGTEVLTSDEHCCMTLFGSQTWIFSTLCNIVAPHHRLSLSSAVRPCLGPEQKASPPLQNRNIYRTCCCVLHPHTCENIFLHFILSYMAIAL
jgi:hypothetical protein